MAVLSKGTNFADGDQVTSTTLDALVDSATFVTGASGTTDDSTLEVNGAGRLQVKALGIGTASLAASAVTTAKIADLNVTVGKLSTGAPSWDSSSNLTVSGNLAVSAADAGKTIGVTNTSSTSAKFPIIQTINYAGGYAGYGIFGCYHANGTSSSPTATASGDLLGSFAFNGYNGSSFQTTAAIQAAATETHSGSVEGTSLLFRATTTGSTSSTIMMNLTDGALAIGQSSTAADASAILELESTTKGLLLPRLTTVQRDAIASAAEGLLIYNTTTNKLNFYNGSSWEAVTSS